MEFDDSFDKWWNSVTPDKRKEYFEGLSEAEQNDLKKHWNDNGVKNDNNRMWICEIFCLAFVALFISFQSFKKSFHDGCESFGLVVLVYFIIFCIICIVKKIRR